MEIKTLFKQFETVRRAGPCNMMDRACVQRYADSAGLYALSSCTKEEYLDIIKNYSEYEKKYGDKNGRK